MRNSRLQLAVGIAVSAFFLWLTLRPVKLADLWLSIRTLNWFWAVPFIAVTTLSMVVRAWRWRYLMKPVGDYTSRSLFGPMMAGFAINSLLPARAGEFARAYIAGKKEKVPFTSVFATVVVERIFDMFTLLLLLAVVFATVQFDPSVRYSYSTKSDVRVEQLVMGVNVAAAVLVLLAVAWALLMRSKVRKGLIDRLEKRSAERKGGTILLRVVRELDAIGPPAWMDGLWILLVLIAVVGMWWVRSGAHGPPSVLHFGREYEISGAMLKTLSRQITIACLALLAGSVLLLFKNTRDMIHRLVEVVPFAPRTIRVKINGLIAGFAQGLASLKDMKTSVIVLLQSVLVWVLVGWSMQIMAYGFKELHMSLMQGIALTVIACIAIIIPAAPGYWGLMELGIQFGMEILGIERDKAVSLGYALVLHSLQYFLVVALGLFYLWHEHISLGEITQKREEP